MHKTHAMRLAWSVKRTGQINKRHLSDMRWERPGEDIVSTWAIGRRIRPDLQAAPRKNEHAAPSPLLGDDLKRNGRVVQHGVHERLRVHKTCGLGMVRFLEAAQRGRDDRRQSIVDMPTRVQHHLLRRYGGPRYQVARSSWQTSGCRGKVVSQDERRLGRRPLLLACTRLHFKPKSSRCRSVVCTSVQPLRLVHSRRRRQSRRPRLYNQIVSTSTCR